MTNTTLPDEVLKTDVLGRVRTPVERREALLEEFERSGVSGKKFAALVGVNYQTFASWVQQRRKARGQYPLVGKKPGARVRVPEALHLVEAVIASEGIEKTGTGGRGLCLQLPGGVRMEIHDARQAALAAELLRALAPRAC
jgi:transposase-like protein